MVYICGIEEGKWERVGAMDIVDSGICFKIQQAPAIIDSIQPSSDWPTELRKGQV